MARAEFREPLEYLQVGRVEGGMLRRHGSHIAPNVTRVHNLQKIELTVSLIRIQDDEISRSGG